MIDSISEEKTFDVAFFETILKLEELYLKQPTQNTAGQLLQNYGDLVHYFEQEDMAVSTYFQSKMKRLINRETTKSPVAQRKKAQEVVAQEKRIQEMHQQEHIEKALTAQIEGIEKYEKKISVILEEQKQQVLQNRKKRSLKRQLTKSASLTMSFDSMLDSPTLLDKSAKKVKQFDTLRLFESLIDSQN